MSYHNHMLYNDILQRKGLLEDFYKAVESLDGTAVLEAYKILGVTKDFPRLHLQAKKNDQSYVFRNQGNDFYQEQNYQMALQMYNKALLYASKGSMEMLHAYGNRSALLFNLNAFTACLRDIETCRKLGCSDELAKKLNKRYEQCMECMWKENLKNNMYLCHFTQEFFKFNVKKHPHVPCLSADVDIISESGERKIVAAKDLKVGTVIAVETAFVSHALPVKSLVTCHYCQKMSLNLIPCDNCCEVLFCSLQCKEHCLKEYHDVECQIMDILLANNTSHKFPLAIKAFLKLKYLCKDWSTLIKEVKNIGGNRLNESSVSEAYNVENYSSILCYKEVRPYIFGTLYNSAFIYASVLHRLERIIGFFPQSISEGHEAKKCFGKLCLMLQLNYLSTEVVSSAEDLSAGQIDTDIPEHFGFFSFAGKMKHSCEPNVLVIGLNNKVAIMALKPIQKMTELTVSFIGHWYEHQYQEQRRMKLYQTILNVCFCRVCTEGWDKNSFQEVKLDPSLKKIYSTWDQLRTNRLLGQRGAAYFRETCKALASFKDHPNTKEHHELFRELRTQLILCQFAATTNVSTGSFH